MKFQVKREKSIVITQQVHKELFHTVAVPVLDNQRAVISVEEIFTSWITTAVTGPIEDVYNEEEH